jgi:hypothetical protein
MLTIVFLPFYIQYPSFFNGPLQPRHRTPVHDFHYARSRAYIRTNTTTTTTQSAEPRPEDQVEISFLRQCLENAMATELTPYERDVLRLRLGLDSGEGKTVREIVELSGGIVSMADVRSAERRAFKKLRSPASVHTHNLLAYLDFGGCVEI